MQTLRLMNSISITALDIMFRKTNSEIVFLFGQWEYMHGIDAHKAFLCVVMTKKLFPYPPEKYILK